MRLRLPDRRLLRGSSFGLLGRGAGERDEGPALLLGVDRVGQVQRLLRVRLTRRGVTPPAEADDPGPDDRGQPGEQAHDHGDADQAPPDR